MKLDSTKRILVTLALCLSCRASACEVLPLNFDQVVFVRTVAKEIAKFYGSNERIERKLRQSIAAREYWLDKKKVYGLNRISLSRLYYHSTPLIDDGFISRVKAPDIFKDLITGDLTQRPALLAAIEAMTGDILSQQLNTRDFVNYPDILNALNFGYRVLFADSLRRGTYKAEQRDYNPEWHLLSLITDPLVTWLATQKKNSVTHLKLFEAAKAIYGDPLTALGVIGFIFDAERMSITSRQYQAVLGSRLTSLFALQNIDTIGTNYHFWAYLNIAILAGGDIEFEHKFSYFWECFKQNDIPEYSTDYQALELGKSILKEVHKYFGKQ